MKGESINVKGYPKGEEAEGMCGVDKGNVSWE